MQTKTRLTITLSQPLLKKIDALIDGHTIRNRSHAIENLVQQGFGTQLSTAVILAGGNHMSEVIPSLQKINNRPLLALTLEHLKNYGITRIIICAGQNEEKIKAKFGTGSSLGMNILYASEKTPLGTAGALKNAQKYLLDEPFLVINDTTLTTINLADLFEFQTREDTLATMCVKPRMSEPKYGQAFLQGNRIVKFADSSQSQGISIVNVGLYILKPELLQLIPKNTSVNLEADIFPKLCAQKELSAFVFQGLWFDVSTAESLRQAIAEFSA